MSRRKRQDIGVFSLSMLDCICCGFGAIILLFVLSKVAEPVVIEQAREDLSGVVSDLQEQLHEIRGETAVLNRELRGRREQISEIKERIARLQGDVSALQGEFAASAQDAQVQTEIEGTLAAALQELTEEMKRLLSTRTARRDSLVGGIPVDSEYIVFIIDTSGSMKAAFWGQAIKLIQETLEVYPTVRGIQVMNDMGRYLFPQYEGKWIPDTPIRRAGIVGRLSTWNVMSNSSPVEGIEAAIRAFHAEDKKVSLYYYGDDFSGERVQPVIDAVDKLNAAGADGGRRVRIHAVGFKLFIPGAPDSAFGEYGIAFPVLMRALCERNGGTFVGVVGAAGGPALFEKTSARIEAEPRELDLGVALPGRAGSGRIRLVNTGRARGEITRARLDCDCGIVRGLEQPWIDPGGSMVIEVEMIAPMAVGEKRTQQVTIEVDHGLQRLRLPVHIVAGNP